MQTRHANSAPTVVGYSTVQAQESGFIMVTPCFTDIAGGSYKIQDIKLTAGSLDDGDVEGDGSESLQILNSEGNGSKTYFWYAAGEAGDEEGWYEGSRFADDVTDVITKGQSFLINNDNGTYAVQFSGQVAEATETIPCDQGFTMIGNYSAQVQSIQKFRPAAGEDGDVEGDGSESMQFLNNLGNGSKTYFWYAAGEAGDEEGWYEGSRFADGEDDVVQPGEGFMYNNDNGTSEMTIPGTVITK